MRLSCSGSFQHYALMFILRLLLELYHWLATGFSWVFRRPTSCHRVYCSPVFPRGSRICSAGDSAHLAAINLTSAKFGGEMRTGFRPLRFSPIVLFAFCICAGEGVIY